MAPEEEPVEPVESVSDPEGDDDDDDELHPPSEAAHARSAMVENFANVVSMGAPSARSGPSYAQRRTPTK
jgi:hypothetical protein